MAYAIFRAERYKTNSGISGIVDHHLRAPGAKIDGVDPSRTHLNVNIGPDNRRGFFEAMNARLATCTRKPRPDANRVVEFMMGASPEFFATKTYDEQKAYLADCLDFAKEHFGEANIVGAYMHFDERTPHLSILATPIETSIRKTKKKSGEQTVLNATHFLGGPEQMVQLQTDFALFVQGRGHDLLRGEPKSETRRKHEPLSVHWRKKTLEIEQAGIAAADLLNEAAMTNRAVSDVLDHVALQANKVDSESLELSNMRADLEASGVGLAEMKATTKRLADGLDTEWTRLKTRVAEVDALQAEAKAENTAAKTLKQEAKATLADAKERLQRVKEDAYEVLKERQFFEKLVPDWHEFRKVQNLIEFGARTLALLNFVHKNPKVAEVLEFAKQDPESFELVNTSVMVAKGLGPGSKPPDTESYGVNLSAANRFVDFIAGAGGGPAGP